MFGIIEEHKKEYKILDYSLTQTTLDDVFVSFAKSQKEASASENDGNHKNKSDRDRDRDSSSVDQDRDLEANMERSDHETDRSDHTHHRRQTNDNGNIDEMVIPDLPVRPRAHSRGVASNNRRGGADEKKSGSGYENIQNLTESQKLLNGNLN